LVTVSQQGRLACALAIQVLLVGQSLKIGESLELEQTHREAQ
jgi:hypothetical protein